LVSDFSLCVFDLRQLHLTPDDTGVDFVALLGRQSADADEVPEPVLAEKPARSGTEDTGDEEVELQTGGLEAGDGAHDEGECGHQLLARGILAGGFGGDTSLTTSLEMLVAWRYH
jgi:hypothetical protein